MRSNNRIAIVLFAALMFLCGTLGIVGAAAVNGWWWPRPGQPYCYECLLAQVMAYTIVVLVLYIGVEMVIYLATNRAIWRRRPPQDRDVVRRRGPYGG